VVEDDAALATMYRSALRFAGFDVQVVSDGIGALRAIDQQTPDLVVLDLHLPRLRGEAILGELSADPARRDIPVVIVTGSDAQAAVAQASAILRKPCAPDTLLAVIEEYLDPAA
jgi:DNA-binding response OmpR family regulator